MILNLSRCNIKYISCHVWRHCLKHGKMLGADNGVEEIARILENKDSRNTLIPRLTFDHSIRNIVYIVKIFFWMSYKCAFIY